MIIHPGCPGGSGRGINERSPFLTPETLCRIGNGWYIFQLPKLVHFLVPINSKTVKKRLRATLAKIKEILRARMHDPIGEVGAWLQRVVYGYYRYHAISGNMKAMNTLQMEITRYWLKTLRRRGQKRRINWQKFGPIASKWIPAPKVYHPYPKSIIRTQTFAFTPNTQGRSPVR